MTAESGHLEIDHTADLGFEVWAPDLDGLLAEATLALADLFYERAQVCPLETRRVQVWGESVEEVLVRWLHEVYLAVETEDWMTASVERVRCDARGADGTLRGEHRDANRHTVHTEIKAITYHGLSVRRGDDGLIRARVIVDV